MTSSPDPFTSDDAVRDEVDAPAFDPTLDSLLRDWHAENRATALSRRDAMAKSMARAARPRTGVITVLRRVAGAPMLRAAAAIVVAVVVAALLLPRSGAPAMAMCDVILVPEGGQLVALDPRRRVVGSCPLQHTDVSVAIEGRFARVTLTQTYANPYPELIEAVYTFPMSHRGAVDRMTMTVGGRVVIGTVKERDEARQIYRSARDAGQTAALLEQERPNIFTQSVANIEPGATITVEISYVETLQVRDGEYEFAFPMTVAPRYIPGAAAAAPYGLPAELTPRRGVVLRGPGRVQPGLFGDGPDARALGMLGADQAYRILMSARPIQEPGALWWGDAHKMPPAPLWHAFSVMYEHGGGFESGLFFTDGTGQLNGRWFYIDPKQLDDLAGGFAENTDQVPDARRITPRPTAPNVRAGHDISVAVTIDSGSVGISHLESVHHELTGTEPLTRLGQAPRTLDLALHGGATIPNRDFVLRWTLAQDDVHESVFTHAARPGAYPGYDGGFATIMIEPPARVETDELLPREIVFVIDSSGSMSGFPIEKAKALLALAIDRLRPADSFNVVSFNNSAHQLFSAPQSANESNRSAALKYVDSRHGGGGTEMLNAVRLAMQRGAPVDPEPVLSARDVLDLPADGRAVRVRVPEARGAVGQGHFATFALSETHAITFVVSSPDVLGRLTAGTTVRGRWEIRDGARQFMVDRVEPAGDAESVATRYVLFVTDGEIGNDDAVVSVVRDGNPSCRFFTIGIGSSPNRSLLDQMAVAGRGAADYLALEENAHEVLSRFVTRIDRPVLTDIEVELSPELELVDAVPPLDALPDLFDESPLTIHARYAKAATGTLTVRGRRAGTPYERTIDVALTGPESNDARASAVPTFWARAQVDQHLRRDERDAVVALGETFQIVTKHTSFVAVERSRVVVDGAPRLVHVPIELPMGQSYHGTFSGIAPQFAARAQQLDLYFGLAASQPVEDVLGAMMFGEIPQSDRFADGRAAGSATVDTDTGLSGGNTGDLGSSAVSGPRMRGSADVRADAASTLDFPWQRPGRSDVTITAGTVPSSDTLGRVRTTDGVLALESALARTASAGRTLRNLSMTEAIDPPAGLDLRDLSLEIGTNMIEMRSGSATDYALQYQPLAPPPSVNLVIGDANEDSRIDFDDVVNLLNDWGPAGGGGAGGGGFGGGGGLGVRAGTEGIRFVMGDQATDGAAPQPWGFAQTPADPRASREVAPAGAEVTDAARERTQSQTATRAVEPVRTPAAVDDELDAIELGVALEQLVPHVNAPVRLHASLPSDTMIAGQRFEPVTSTVTAQSARAAPLDAFVAQLGDPELTWWRAYDANVIGPVSVRDASVRYVVQHGRLQSYHVSLLAIVAALESRPAAEVQHAVLALRDAGGDGPLLQRVLALAVSAGVADASPDAAARHDVATAIRTHMAHVSRLQRIEVALRRVIDPVLWPAAFAPTSPDADVNRVQVTILLDVVNDERIAALRDAGARDVAAGSGHPLVVATVPTGHLLRVAASPGVRRVEPFIAE